MAVEELVRTDRTAVCRKACVFYSQCPLDKEVVSDFSADVPSNL